jgi:hypothetical protein
MNISYFQANMNQHSASLHIPSHALQSCKENAYSLVKDSCIAIDEAIAVTLEFAQRKLHTTELRFQEVIRRVTAQVACITIIQKRKRKGMRFNDFPIAVDKLRATPQNDPHRRGLRVCRDGHGIVEQDNRSIFEYTRYTYRHFISVVLLGSQQLRDSNYPFD